MSVSITTPLIFVYIMCVNTQVRTASWDITINTTASSRIHWLYTSQINHHTQTCIHRYMHTYKKDAISSFFSAFQCAYQRTYIHRHIIMLTRLFDNIRRKKKGNLMGISLCRKEKQSSSEFSLASLVSRMHFGKHSFT